MLSQLLLLSLVTLLSRQVGTKFLQHLSNPLKMLYTSFALGADKGERPPSKRHYTPIFHTCQHQRSHPKSTNYF